MTILRTWQQAALEKALAYYDAEDVCRPFIINAAPGAGKTRVSCAIARQLLASGAITRVIIIAPRSTVVDQWADDFRKITGRTMTKVTNPDDMGSAEHHVCATWTAVKSLADVFQAICVRDRVLVICDEHHHAAITAAWGASADSAFRDAAYSLILTGTPLRSDGAASVWMALDDLGGIDHPPEGMYTLTYGEAVELGYCRPVTFHRHRGLFTVDLGNGHSAQVSSDGPPVFPVETVVDSVLRRVVDFQRLAKTPQYLPDGVSPRMDGYQATMIACAREKLEEIQLTMPEAAGLIIAPDILMAEYLGKIIEAAEGHKPVIVHSGIQSAERRIASFRDNHSKRWLVSVGMVTEGVDIPRLRVLVYLPSAGTELAFRQAVGRVVRNYGHNDSSRAYVVMPALATFDEYARRIEDDLPAPGIRGDAMHADKTCRICKGRSAIAEPSCEHCGADFPSRPTNFRLCECGAFCRLSDAHCNACGKDATATFEITLAAAARDGVISRGVIVPEEEVLQAEALAPIHRSMLAKAERENEVLARILRTVPIELLPSFIRLVAAAETGEGG